MKMKGQRLICLTTVIALSEVLVTAYAYGTGTAGRPSSTTPGYPDSSEHDHDGHEQWGGPNNDGVGQYGQQSGQKVSSQPGNQDNFFSRTSHVELYGVPEGCVDGQKPRDICDYFVQISKEPKEPGYLNFELFRHIAEPNKGGWVAVGLSTDEFMGDDDMVECVMSDNAARMYQSWATGRTRPIRLRDDPHVLISEHGYPQYNEYNKSLTCKFKRPIRFQVPVPGKPPVEIDLIRGKYYVLLAEGNLKAGNADELGYHGDNPIKTGNAYVSHNLLGYQKRSENSGKHNGQHGFSSGNSGQTVGGFVFVMLYGFLRLVY